MSGIPTFRVPDSDEEMDTELETSSSETSMETDETETSGSETTEDIELMESPPRPTFIVHDSESEEESQRSPSGPFKILSEVQESSSTSAISDRFRCPVCLMSFAKLNTLAITCGHVLCADCIETLDKFGTHNCPVCKRRFRKSHAKKIYF